jgi:GTP diphosphokinase / guanosine-3',5'-bis(diphosphate) 3'-diphosphatase
MQNNKIVTFEDLLLNVKKYIYNEKEIKMITDAYNCAERMHEGQERESGEDYIQHPLNVALILSEIYADADTIAAALLHDVVEDTNIILEDIVMLFNKTVANLVDGMTKIKGMDFGSREEAIVANRRKIIMTLNEDIRIIIIKLADRLHNMRTLWVKKEKKQKENAQETLDIFVPLAYHLGAYKIKNELADLSLKYLEPDVYDDLSIKLNMLKMDRMDYILDMKKDISNILNDNKINHDIFSRFKHIYGVYKCLNSGKKLDEINDLWALKICLVDTKDCYLGLGLIHNEYRPIQGKIKDYIALPKTNMYQSLHTTVFGKDSSLVQVQIRTKEMEIIANHGITCHWLEKKVNADKIMQEELKEKFQFFKSLTDICNANADDISFMKMVKEELLEDNIYVSTPKGRIIELPIGSTPIDLAYKIDANIGHKAIAALINNNYAELDTVLNNKDIVEVITDEQKEQPDIAWLHVVKTEGAKAKIKQYYNHLYKK